MSNKVNLLQHEALHMSLFLAEAVETQLMDHKYLQDNPEKMKLAEAANEALLDLYQAIGGDS